MAVSVIDERPMFIVRKYSYKISSIGSGSRVTVTAANFGIENIDGYVFAGVRSVYGGASSLAVYRITPATGTSQVFRIMNQYGDAMTNKTATIEVLFMREDFCEDE